MAKKKMTFEEKLEEAIVKDAPYEVPDNWIWSNVGSISLEIKNGTTIKQNKDEIGIKVTRIESLQNNGIDLNRLGTIIETEKIKEQDYYIDGDIALSHINSLEHVGKTALIDNSLLPLVHGMNLLRIRVNKRMILPKYFQLYTRGYDYKKFVVDRVNRAVNQVSLNQKNLSDVPMPIPPLKEQQRIVDKIESLFEKLDKAKELIEEARDDFENRKKIILRDAFVGKLTRNYRSRNNFKSNAYDLIKDIRNELEQWYKEECITAKLVGNKKPRKLNFDIQKSEFEYLFKEIPLTWRVSYFQEIIEPVDNALKAGPFGSSLKKSMYVEKGYKIYGQEQVISGNISYGDYYINEEKFNELKSCEVREGDLLISLVGTIGKTLIMPKEYEKGIINPRLLKISVNKKISAEYIKMYFESPIAKYIMSEKSHGGTMEILNLDIIKKLPIPIPPIEEQIEIVRILDKIFEEESKIEELTQLEEQIELIKKSILAKAFRGQLGTNCEDDESALELLKEIIE
jgi:type I restriction enzyme S subunit